QRGVSTGGNLGRTLNDTNQNWTPGYWGPVGFSTPNNPPRDHYEVRITFGKGAGQPPIPIVSNTATQLVLAQPWLLGQEPDATSSYEIREIALSNKSHTGI